MTAQRLFGTLLLAVAVIIYIINDDNKMATFAMWMLILFGGAAMIRLQPKRRDVRGKAVFITGCDTGFGNAFARALDNLGCVVFAGCLKPDGPDAQTLKTESTENLHIVPLDVTNDASVENAVKYIKGQTSEELWAVVNNAGINLLADTELCTMDMYKRVAEVNLFGMIRVANRCLSMIKKSKGRVINVTSVKGIAPFPLTSAYSVTKYGMEAFSDILRIEMRRWGVQVVIIEPSNFGAITRCLSFGDNKPMHGRTFVDDFNEVWDCMDESQRQDYGREYIDAEIKATKDCAETTHPNMDPVVEQVVEAVAALYPKDRYLIAGSNSRFDTYKVIAVLSQWLPVEIIDFIMEYTTFSGLPLPKALQNVDNKQDWN